MKYCSDLYETLCQGYPPEPNETFSASFKRNMQNNRMHQFVGIVDYLEEENIDYEMVKDGFDIKVKDMIIQPNMKVKFDGSKKLYQYNYDKIIKRINKNE